MFGRYLQGFGISRGAHKLVGTFGSNKKNKIKKLNINLKGNIYKGNLINFGLNFLNQKNILGCIKVKNWTQIRMDRWSAILNQTQRMLGVGHRPLNHILPFHQGTP